MSQKKTFLKRKGKRNKHHNLAKSRGGKATIDNLILLDENRHAAFHLLFGNRTLEEASKLLSRASSMLERRKQ